MHHKNVDVFSYRFYWRRAFLPEIGKLNFELTVMTASVRSRSRVVRSAISGENVCKFALRDDLRCAIGKGILRKIFPACMEIDCVSGSDKDTNGRHRFEVDSSIGAMHFSRKTSP